MGNKKLSRAQVFEDKNPMILGICSKTSNSYKLHYKLHWRFIYKSAGSLSVVDLW